MYLSKIQGLVISIGQPVKQVFRKGSYCILRDIYGETLYFHEWADLSGFLQEVISKSFNSLIQAIIERHLMANPDSRISILGFKKEES